MPAAPTPRIAIVGGGIGGLAAALFLRSVGIEATVYEQAGALREIGAGLVVPPNMVRPLQRLGLGVALEQAAVRLHAAWEFRRWQDGRVLSVQPMDEVCRQLYGAECYVAHRAELLHLLLQALPAHQLKLDHRCTAVSTRDDGVQLRFAQRDNTEVIVQADAVIGADGIHSVVRAAVASKVDVRFSGLCAFRCLVPAQQAPAMALRPVQTLWLGPGRHFVHYPIRGGQLVNVVAIVPAGDWQQESWTAPGRLADLRAEFDGWDARLTQLIDAASETLRWAMLDRAPLPRWTDGRITLLGDAAHAMLPFFAQGAAQALEDAEALAFCLRDVDRAALPQALARYDALRRPRASQVQLMSRGREIRNHLPDGPEQLQRDAELARGDPLVQSAWLYGSEHERALKVPGT
jgi:salicylate hydroxylase